MRAAGSAAASKRDRAVVGIVISNLLTLAMAWWQDWPLVLLLWPYWSQSLILGGFARRRILALETFSTEGLRIKGEAAAATPQTRRSTANFFALHYGFFHLGYLVFLVVNSTGQTGQALRPSDLLLILGLSLAFWFTHRASHREHVAADLRRVPNIGALMFLPYLRILPMHLTLLFGLLLPGAFGVLLFGTLKTLADVLMHKAEHRQLQGAGTGRAVARTVE